MTILSKDKLFAGLINIIGYSNAKYLIDRNKNKSSFQTLLDHYNSKGKLIPRDVITLVGKTKLNISEDKRKKLKRYLSSISTLSNK